MGVRVRVSPGVLNKLNLNMETNVYNPSAKRVNNFITNILKFYFSIISVPQFKNEYTTVYYYKKYCYVFPYITGSICSTLPMRFKAIEFPYLLDIDSHKGHMNVFSTQFGSKKQCCVVSQNAVVIGCNIFSQRDWNNFAKTIQKKIS